MKTHQQIDARSLGMARSIVRKIDDDPARQGLEKATKVCQRWVAMGDVPGAKEWLRILRQPWSQIRAVLLDESEEGQRLRQNSPFCGILSPRERWEIYRSFREDESA